MPKENKSTELEFSNRVDIVNKMLLEGYSQHEIFLKANDEYEWNVSDRQLYRYIEKCAELRKKVFSKEREELLLDHVAKRNELYKKALKNERVDTALRVLDSLAELQGLRDKAGPEQTAVEIIEGKDIRITKIYRLAEQLRKRSEVASGRN